MVSDDSAGNESGLTPQFQLLLADYVDVRQDDRSGTSVMVATYALGLLMIGGILAAVDRQCGDLLAGPCPELPALILLGMPLAPIAVLAFLSMMMVAMNARAIYMIQLEEELHSRSDLVVVPDRGKVVALPAYVRLMQPIWTGLYASILWGLINLATLLLVVSVLVVVNGLHPNLWLGALAWGVHGSSLGAVIVYAVQGIRVRNKGLCVLAD